jgi:hypothetical protein
MGQGNLFICDGTRELTEACTKTAALLRLPLKESSCDAKDGGLGKERLYKKLNFH